MLKKKLSTSVLSGQIIQSEIRTMSIECDKVDGINLSQGVCDLGVPSPVRRGAQRAIDQGINHYTRYDGLPALRSSLARKLRRYNHVDADPEKNIIVSGGATGAFYCACLALLNPGDEVIVFEPFYGYHINTLLAVGSCPVYVPLEPPGWTFDMGELEKKVSRRTKGIVINTPANPSGKVFTRAELDILARFSVRHDLFIFTDEIYEYFVYDGREHISPASLPGIKKRTIMVSGYSKTFSITGWRIGYCVCDQQWATTIGYINDLVYVCGPAPLQIGVSTGIDELAENYYQSLSRQYRAKRDKICAALAQAGLTPFVPQGAYYVLADASILPGKTSKAKAMYLLTKTGVASVPGEAFFHSIRCHGLARGLDAVPRRSPAGWRPAGSSLDKSDKGKNLLRFCFAKDDKVLDKACRNLLKLKSGGK